VKKSTEQKSAKVGKDGNIRTSMFQPLHISLKADQCEKESTVGMEQLQWTTEGMMTSGDRQMLGSRSDSEGDRETGWGLVVII
jgi:hypothetical protein